MEKRCEQVRSAMRQRSTSYAIWHWVLGNYEIVYTQDDVHKVVYFKMDVQKTCNDKNLKWEDNEIAKITIIDDEIRER